MSTLLIASNGGHLKQLHRLRDRLRLVVAVPQRGGQRLEQERVPAGAGVPVPPQLRIGAVDAVAGESRVAEIARMLGGEKLSSTSLAHAQEMLTSSALPPPAKARKATR